MSKIVSIFRAYWALLDPLPFETPFPIPKQRRRDLKHHSQSQLLYFNWSSSPLLKNPNCIAKLHTPKHGQIVHRSGRFCKKCCLDLKNVVLEFKKKKWPTYRLTDRRTKWFIERSSAPEKRLKHPSSHYTLSFHFQSLFDFLPRS